MKTIDRTLYSVQVAIVEKKDKVEKFKEEAGCFVLLSNVPEEGATGHSSEEILQAYKDQYGIEQNFGFQKILSS